MPKPDAALLDPARYPFRCEVEPRSTDVDGYNHINNIAMIDILQEARVKLHRASAYSGALAGVQTMTAHFAVDFLAQTFYPDVTVHHLGISRVGRSSHTIEQVACQRGKVVAYAQTVMVCVQDDAAVEQPAAFLESVKDWMLS
ncbi:MAG TPA: acyl-CoA thioesterase [Novosphingobium sp.]|nr:acyl-CoA thioesterase [Novosphingobium sp.]